jgi:hypothetical protein
MSKQFLADHYYPVDIRLGIIYNDPYRDEADCGLGSEKYHGLGTIGIKGIHLTRAEMYEKFRIEAARKEPSTAYVKWERSGFHSYMNSSEGLDTKPVRPSGLDILRACTHTTHGGVCADCLKKAAAAEKILIKEQSELAKLPTDGKHYGMQPPELRASGLRLAESELQDDDPKTEVFAPMGEFDDETLLTDPVEAALLRLDLGTRPETWRQDVALVREALDRTFSLQQQLAESQRNMHRALLAEIQRTAEDTEQLIERLLHVTAERDDAYQEATKTQHQLSNTLVQRDKLLEVVNELLQHFEIEDEHIELRNVYKAKRGDDPALLRSVLKIWRYVRTLQGTLRQNQH